MTSKATVFMDAVAGVRRKRIKLKDGLIHRQIAGQHVVIPVGGNVADFNGVITLNDTAGFLWGRLKAGAEPASLADALLGEYEVSRGEAERDVEEFLALLREHKVLLDE